MAAMDKLLIDLARGNHGIFTRQEAAERGFSNKMLRTRIIRGALVEVLPGIFWLRAVPYAWESKVRAATAWSEPSAGACRTAAAGWGLDGFNKDVIEVVSTRALHPPDWLTLRRTRDFDRSDVRVRNGLPFTSLERTLAELGAVCPPAKVERALDDAVRKRMTTLSRVHAYLEAHGVRGRNGCGTLRRLVEIRMKEPKVTQSDFEDAFLALTKRFGLPTPVKQHPVVIENRRFFLDFAYPSSMLGIEAWSYAHHSDRDDWDYDQDRHNLVSSLGWRLLYVTYRQLCRTPERLVNVIRALLAQPGLSKQAPRSIPLLRDAEARCGHFSRSEDPRADEGYHLGPRRNLFAADRGAGAARPSADEVAVGQRFR